MAGKLQHLLAATSDSLVADRRLVAIGADSCRLAGGGSAAVSAGNSVVCRETPVGSQVLPADGLVRESLRLRRGFHLAGHDSGTCAEDRLEHLDGWPVLFNLVFCAACGVCRHVAMAP